MSMHASSCALNEIAEHFVALKLKKQESILCQLFLTKEGNVMLFLIICLHIECKVKRVFMKSFKHCYVKQTI